MRCCRPPLLVAWRCCPSDSGAAAACMPALVTVTAVSVALMAGLMCGWDDGVAPPRRRLLLPGFPRLTGHHIIQFAHTRLKTLQTQSFTAAAAPSARQASERSPGCRPPLPPPPTARCCPHSSPAGCPQGSLPPPGCGTQPAGQTPLQHWRPAGCRRGWGCRTGRCGRRALQSLGARRSWPLLPAASPPPRFPHAAAGRAAGARPPQHAAPPACRGSPP